ncbi:Phosphohistidine phosphatase, SixA [Candidatus Terasakiella magnetica]|nr:Phosphohistidine phosphatase, SixA [Candidatus Terasakiella magnetica]
MKIMRKLFLLRHAKSSWDDTSLDDFERPLNLRGEQSAHAMAAFLAKSHIRPGLVLVSGAVRTRATWDAIEPVMEGVSAAIEESLYEAGKGDLLNRLRALDDHTTSVMLIGHNPGLGRLASILVCHQGETQALGRMNDKFSTGALAEIDLEIDHWAELEAGCGRLVRFIRPKDLTP